MKHFSSLLCLAALSMPTLAAEKHVHGEAELFVAIQKDKVLLELESPADNILGFEHAPTNKAQEKWLEKNVALLGQYDNLIDFPNSQCQQKNVNIKSPLLGNSQDEHAHKGDHRDGHKHDEHKHKEEHAHDHDKHKHDDHGHDEHKHKDDHKDHGHDDHHGHGEEHSGFHVSYTLNCKNADAIKQAQINIFKSFERFEKVNVFWVAGDKQGSKTTTPKNTNVMIK